VEALKAPPGTTIVDDPGIIVIGLVPPRVEPTAVTEAPEPEVIGGAATEE
jgi:hypothetical protein